MKGCRKSTLINGCNFCLSELQSRRKSLQATLSSMLRRSVSATSSLKSTNVPSKPIAMQESTFYMRTLPEHTIAFSSSKGKVLFKQALMANTMENYFKLAEQFTTQQEPAYCGPASLIMVLNSLQIDPNKKWKGIWRWYSEEVLHCSSTEEMQKGLSLE